MNVPTNQREPGGFLGAFGGALETAAQHLARNLESLEFTMLVVIQPPVGLT